MADDSTFLGLVEILFVQMQFNETSAYSVDLVMEVKKHHKSWTSQCQLVYPSLVQPGITTNTFRLYQMHAFVQHLLVLDYDLEVLAYQTSFHIAINLIIL